MARFSGKVSNLPAETKDVTLVYTAGAAFVQDKNRYELDLSTQSNSSVAGFAKYDFMSVIASVTLSGDQFVGATETPVTMKHDVTMAHFTTDLPEGTVVTVASDKIQEKFIRTAGGYTTAGGLQKQLTATVAANGELYVALNMGRTGCSPEITFTAGDKTATLPAPATAIAPGSYLRGEFDATTGTSAGIPVTFTPDQPEDPNNPGNISNWPNSDDNDIIVNLGSDQGTLTLMDENLTAWCLNERTASTNHGGFCTYITYPSNSIKGSRLVSDGNTNNIYYYQWGRWLGFTSNVARGRVTYNGMHSYDQDSQWSYFNVLQLPGLPFSNMNLAATLKYITDNTHAMYQLTDATNWNKTIVDRSHICFGYKDQGSSHYDYMSPNNECNWEDRTGNPCPDGYRVPTADELEALFVPSNTSTISGTYYELKQIKGSYYAIRWKVGTYTNGVPYLEVTSVAATSTTNPAQSSLYNGAPYIRLGAYGYLNNLGNLGGSKEYASYWSSTPVKLEDETWGSKALDIHFTNGSATIIIENTYRVFGYQVIPIKDATAKATPITPWLPYGNIR